jgi:hypothetical protein
MLTARSEHAAVYHQHCLYVLGGNSERGPLRESERYVSAVVLERSLYALGGGADQALDLIQKLRIEDLTWEIIELRLPQAGRNIALFKHRDCEVYLVIDKTLYSFTPLQLLPLKTLPTTIKSYGGPSYYSLGTLYCSSIDGPLNRLEVGSLN